MTAVALPFLLAAQLFLTQPISSQIQSTETHTLQSEPGQFLWITVTGGMTLGIQTPDSKTAIENANFPVNGVKELFYITTTAGPHRITLSTKEPANYQLELRQQRPATAEDRARAAAFQASMEARTVLQWEQALQLWKPLNDETWLAYAQHELGNGYFSNQQLPKARDALLAAAVLRRKIGDPRLLALTLSTLGAVYSDLGEYPVAIKLLDEALPLRRLAKDRRGEANTLHNIAFAQVRLGNREKAIELHQQAIVIRREINDMPGLALGLGNLSTLYRTMGLAERALAMSTEQLAITKTLNNPRAHGDALSGLASIHYALGDLAEAQKLWLQAEPLYQASNDPFGISNLLASLAALSVQQRRYADAASYYQRSLELRQKSSSAQGQMLSHVGLCTVYARTNELTKARQSGEHALAIATRISLTQGMGKAHRCLGEADRRAANWSGAREHLQQAAGYFRANSDSDELSLTLASLAAVESEAGNLPLALRHAKESQSLIEVERKGLTGDLRASLRASRADSYALEIDLLMRTNQPSQALEAAERSRARTLIEAIADARLDTAAPPLSLKTDQIRTGMIESGATLLEYALGEKRSYVWALSSQGLHSAILPPRDEIEKQIHRYHRELSQRVTGLTASASQLRLTTQSRILYQLLIAPVEKALPEGKTLVIAPDGALAYLPFETLTARVPLLERFAINYAPSASTLAELRRRAGRPDKGPNSFVAFADPVYNGVASSQAERATAYTQLPNTRPEANAIAALFQPANRRIYLGAEATAAKVKEQDLTPFRYIHLAAHGYVDEEQPAHSGIVLSSNSILRVPEIMRLRLQADAVTLSACQTGLGQVLAGEGVMGLTRAFLYAGAQSVVASLWNVNDAATAELMKAFYRNVSRGQSRAEALRQAKLSLLRGSQPTWRHPYFWAPFIFAGDAGTN